MLERRTPQRANILEDSEPSTGGGTSSKGRSKREIHSWASCRLLQVIASRWARLGRRVSRRRCGQTGERIGLARAPVCQPKACVWPAFHFHTPLGRGGGGQAARGAGGVVATAVLGAREQPSYWTTYQARQGMARWEECRPTEIRRSHPSRTRRIAEARRAAPPACSCMARLHLLLAPPRSAESQQLV